jgi:hypothetical protein
MLNSYNKTRLTLLTVAFQFLQIVSVSTVFAQSVSSKTSEQTLLTLPIPLTRYNLDGEPIFKLSADAKTNILILPVNTTIKNNNERVGRVFINGKLKGDFKGVNVADFTDNNGNLVYRTSDGKTETVYGLPKFKGASPAQIEKTNQQIEQRIQELKAPDYINKAIDATKKELKGYGESDEQINEYIKKVFTSDYVNKHVAELKTYQKSYQADQSKLKDITEFYTTDNFSGEGIAGIMQNNQPGEYLVIVSPSFATAKIYLFKNGVLAAANDIPLYFNVAQNAKKTKFAYRGQSIGSLDDSEIMVIDDGVEGKKYAWTSQPTYNINDEVMYMAASTLPKTEVDKTKITCKAVVGTTETDVQCNDPLFFSLTHQSPYFRFPMMSEDGKTTVYPELTKAGVYVNNDYEQGITTPFESRLVINGKPSASHPFIDKPFFTSKGLATISYTAKGEQYVEWDGKTSPMYQAVGTAFIGSYGFNGYSSLFAALQSFGRGDLGVDELKSELVVSPDGTSIAFAGYNKGGWDVSRDMKTVGTYMFVDQLSYSPDSKHLAFAAVSGRVDSKVDPNSDVATSVIVDGKAIDKHQKIIHLQYSPEGMLTYIGQNQKKYTLYLNGKEFGTPFDLILMPPRFKDGMIEVVGARNDRIVLLRQSISEVGALHETPSQGNTSSQAVVVPTTTNPQGITLIKTIKNRIPPNLKPLRIGTKKSSVFYSDTKNKKAVFVVSLAQEDKNGKIYNLYQLEGETPSKFKILSPYYAVGNKVYSYADARLTAYYFQMNIATYGMNVSVLPADVKNFKAVGRHATDGKNAFYLKEIIQADVPSFKPLNEFFAKDKYSLFANGRSYLEADVDTFAFVNNICGADKQAFYCYDNEVIQFPLMDVKTFKYLAGGVAKDMKNIVYKNNILRDLDATTVRVVQGGNDKFLIDKNAVYIIDSFICKEAVVCKFQDADPATFTMMPMNWSGQSFSKDKKHVWHSSYIVDGADGATFEFINSEISGYAKDAKHVFWYSDLMKDADVKTFKLLNPNEKNYGVDAKHVYFQGNVVKGANPKTFTIPAQNY